MNTKGKTMIFGKQKHSQDSDSEATESREAADTTTESDEQPTRETPRAAHFDQAHDSDRDDYTDGPKRSPFLVLKLTAREFSDDGGTDLAAALTYYAVLALFPALIALFSIVGLVGKSQQAEVVDKLLEVAKPLVSDSVYKQLPDILNGLASAPGAGITLVIGILGAIWSASGYVGAFSRAMNRIYEVEEGRPFWRMRPMQLVVTVTSMVLCIVALVILIVSGPVAKSIGDTIGLGNDLVVVWGYVKWPVLAIVVMVNVAILYWATPNVKFTSFRIISVGAFVAILVWIVASVGFAFYVATFSSYNKTYGSLAGAVVALLWLWLTNVALIFGAELDAELERGRELQIGLAAEEMLQLPVRSTRGIEKSNLRRLKDVQTQREIREAAAGPGDPGDRPFGRR